jgi:hypothetical protein
VKCIVPLAGGDLEHPVHGFRPWVPVEGERLLKRALDQRAWRSRLSGSDFVFVVRSVAKVDELEAWLSAEWPGCAIVRLPAMTRGAMFTALAGIAALPADNEPIVVDLADILFGGIDPSELLGQDVGAVIPCFVSNEDCYSYLRMNHGEVVEAAEKRVISDRASAGVYFFADRPTFLDAAVHSIDHSGTLTVKGVFFVCPMANGVLARGKRVLAPLVDNVTPIGKIFH